jgi:hypothetical protein
MYVQESRVPWASGGNPPPSAKAAFCLQYGPDGPQNAWTAGRGKDFFDPAKQKLDFLQWPML